MLYVILAAVWAVMALGLFLWPWLMPGAQLPTILGTGIPWAWVAVILALFNLARWAATRAERQRRALLEQQARRRRPEREPTPWQREPDPTFDFSEGPPPRRPEPPAGPG
jgi:hypothetical protein